MQKNIRHWLLVASFVIASLGCDKVSEVKRESDSLLSSQQKNPDFAKAFKISGKYNQRTKMLKIDVVLANGFHAYAPGELVGKPINLSVSDTNNWRIDGKVLFPVGKKQQLEFQGESILLTDNFSLSARVVDGKGSIEARIDLQVCSDKFCDRPREHVLVIPPKDFE